MSLDAPPRVSQWQVQDLRTKLEWELEIAGEELRLRRAGTTLTAHRRETVGGKVVTLDHSLVSPILRYDKEGTKLRATLPEDAAVSVVQWLEVSNVVASRSNLVLMIVALFSILYAMPLDADPSIGAPATPFKPEAVLVALFAMIIVLWRRRRPAAITILLEAIWFGLLAVSFILRDVMDAQLDPWMILSLLPLWPAVVFYKLYRIVQLAEPPSDSTTA